MTLPAALDIVAKRRRDFMLRGGYPTHEQQRLDAEAAAIQTCETFSTLVQVARAGLEAGQTDVVERVLLVAIRYGMDVGRLLAVTGTASGSVS